MTPLASLAALICVGIGVDFSGQALAEQDLRDRAGHCARESAQGVPLGAITALNAVASAYQCLSAQGMTGTVQLVDDTLVIRTSGTYRTKILTIIAIDQLPIRGTASAVVLQGR